MSNQKRPDDRDEHLNTQDLARRARAAGSEGFAELYRSVAPAILVWARVQIHANLRSRLDPEDVLQETAARAWQRFAEFDPERANFRTWIFGIGRNVLLEAFRKLNVVGPIVSGGITSMIGTLPDTETSITRDVARRESLAAFSEHVSALPREEQRLLLYRGLEERSHEEVAQLLNVSIEAATKRWHRLRDRLLAEIGGEEFMAA